MNSRSRNHRFSCVRSKGDEQQTQKYQNNITGASKTDVCVIPAANEHKFPLISVRLLCLNNPKCSRTRFPILDLNLLFFGFSHPVWTHLDSSLITLLLECGSTCEGHDTQIQTIQKASWQEANTADRKWQTRIWLSSSLLPKNSTPPHVAMLFTDGCQCGKCCYWQPACSFEAVGVKLPWKQHRAQLPAWNSETVAAEWEDPKFLLAGLNIPKTTLESPNRSAHSWCDDSGVSMCPHLVWQVEGGDAKGPEAAEHREDAEAQVISGRHQQKGVLTLWLAGVLTLNTQGSEWISGAQ